MDVSFITALGLSLAGGLLLNLMPCVLPVLSLKLVSLSRSAHQGEGRGSALAYTAGILSTMLLLWLALRSVRFSAGDLGWGFWMQQPAVVGALAVLMTAFGLSMAGQLHLSVLVPGRLAALSRRDGVFGDFMTGVLAVAVAAPCTAPAMGTAMAYAFAAPPVASLGVFAGLGVGLALPVLAVAWIPGAMRLVPKPGAWMERLKLMLSLPLFAAALWLLWVGYRQAGPMFLAVAGTACILLAGLSVPRGRARGRYALGMAVLLLAAGLGLHRPSSPAPVGEITVVEPASLRDTIQREVAAGRTVFVDVTADWCVTCLANEKRVFDTQAFRASVLDRGVRVLRADYSEPSDTLTAYLKSHRAVGVPLYVVYGPGTPAGQVLPTVLTLSAIEDAVVRSRPG